jgi:peptide deformylase
MKILRRTQFGNSILRQKAHKLSEDEILSKEIQELIANMRYTLKNRNYGIGIAAPQVGKSLALSIIEIAQGLIYLNLIGEA